MDKGTKVLILINIVLLATLGILYFTMFSDSKTNRSNKHSSTNITNTVSELPTIASDRDDIQNMIVQTLGSEVEKFSVYLFRPSIENEPLIFQSRPLRPASMIKVFVLAKVMQDSKDGLLSLDELIPITAENIVGGAGSIAGEGVGAKVPIRKAVELMIIESDNTATNILIDKIGLENLNQYIKSNGYNDTVIHHKMMLQTEQSNLSSVADLGMLFKKIYESKCVDEFHDNLMVSYLLKQQDKECFPSALPYWNIAHKTGEVSNLYDDGGIFFGSQGDFILVIMNDNIESRGEAIDMMKNIASNIAKNFMVKSNE